jgi:hypothetical protein
VSEGVRIKNKFLLLPSLKFEVAMKKVPLLLIVSVILAGCAAPGTPAKAIYAIAKQDKYSGANASRESFGINETPCIKISGYGSSVFSYRLYKEDILESIDSGNVTKQGDNEVLTCWKSLPEGFYTFQIYDSSGTYVDTIKFSIGQ